MRQWVNGMVFGAVLLASIGWADVIGRANQTSDLATVTQDLISALDQQDEARVILLLDMPFEPERPSLSRTFVDGQRKAIASKQTEVSRALTRQGIPVARKFTTIPGLVASISREQLAQLRQTEGIRSIERDIPVPPALDTSVGIIGADQLHNGSTAVDGDGWAIAVLDTGVDATHPMMAGDFNGSKVVAEGCFSTNFGTSVESLCPGGVTTSTQPGAGGACDLTVSGCDHGTHVASIAAGASVTFNGQVVSGVAPQADVIAMQVFTQFNSQSDCYPSNAPCVLSFTSDQVAALDRVIQLADTINIAAVNMSLGGGRYYSACDQTRPLKTAIETLKNMGIPTVIASGNSGYSDSVSSPACVSDAVTVGATTKTDGLASYSNTHPDLIDLYAPGTGITAALAGGSYVSYSGTSMATPHVAGAFALMREKFSTAEGTDAMLRRLQSSSYRVTIDRQSAPAADFSHPRLYMPDAISASLNPIVVVGFNGSGRGVVTSVPAGIDCGDVCRMDVQDGDSILLTAVAEGDSTFEGWKGAGCDGNDPSTGECIVVVDEAVEVVTATFAEPKPANDDFADATVITDDDLPYENIVSTFSATGESNESPPSCDDEAGRSVWYRWTSGTVGQAVVHTDGSDFDTILSVHRLSDGVLSEVGCDFGTSGGGWTDSSVTFNTEQNAVYYIRVSGYMGTGGALKLSVTKEFSQFILTATTNGFGEGQLVSQPAGITCGAGATQCSANFDLGTSVTLTATPSDASSLLSRWSGDCGAVLGTDSTCVLNMDSNRQVAATFDSVLINDDLTSAKVISSLPFTDGLSTQFASNEPNEVVPGAADNDDPFLSNCAGPMPIEGTVWYRWTAPNPLPATPLVIDLTGSAVSFDTAVAMYVSSQTPENTGFDDLTVINCNDDVWPVVQSRLRTVTVTGSNSLQAGETYYIQVGGRTDMRGELAVEVYFGEYVLTVTGTSTDANGLQIPGWSEVTNIDTICLQSMCDLSFKSGEEVTIRHYTPSPNGLNNGTAKHGFVGWQGCDSTNLRDCIVTMNSDRTVTAQVTPTNAQELVVDFVTAGRGSVASLDGSIRCLNTDVFNPCSSSYLTGETVILDAIPLAGYAVQWPAACSVPSGNPRRCELTIPSSDVALTVDFVPVRQLTLSTENRFKTARSSAGGRIVVSQASNTAQRSCGTGCTEYPSNTTVSLTVSLNDTKSRFVRWAGSCSGTQATCQVTLDENRKVTALFEVVPEIFQDKFKRSVQ